MSIAFVLYIDTYRDYCSHFTCYPCICCYLMKTGCNVATRYSTMRVSSTTCATVRTTTGATAAWLLVGVQASPLMTSAVMAANTVRSGNPANGILCHHVHLGEPAQRSSQRSSQRSRNVRATFTLSSTVSCRLPVSGSVVFVSNFLGTLQDLHAVGYVLTNDSAKHLLISMFGYHFLFSRSDAVSHVAIGCGPIIDSTARQDIGSSTTLTAGKARRMRCSIGSR